MLPEVPVLSDEGFEKGLFPSFSQPAPSDELRQGPFKAILP
jgi:hypothetical protein